MKWIFDHFQLVIIVGSSIAWWLMKQKEANQPPPEHGERPGRQPIDYDDSDAAREVRERMRRLREQRGEAPVRPPPGSTPTARPLNPRADEIPPILRELLGIPSAPAEPVAPPQVPDVQAETQAAVARQERMRVEMRELELRQREAEALANQVRARSADAMAVGRRRTRTATGAAGPADDLDLLSTLRHARSARRAIILREVLDKPVALR